MDVYLPIADSLVGMVNTLVWMWSSLLNTLILSLLNLWFFLSFLLFSTLIPIFLLSPVTSHFVANRCFHQTAQKNLTVSEKTNLSSAWTYVELHLYPMIIYLCASWTTSDDEEEILLRTGWTWRQKMDKDSVTWMQNKGWQRWNMGGECTKLWHIPSTTSLLCRLDGVDTVTGREDCNGNRAASQLAWECFVGVFCFVLFFNARIWTPVRSWGWWTNCGWSKRNVHQCKLLADCCLLCNHDAFWVYPVGHERVSSAQNCVIFSTHRTGWCFN